MFNLFDILQSQGGGGMQALGQQYGLSPDQSRRAMEALLPALTICLQRNAATDPVGFGRLFGLSGADPSRGAQPDQLLGQLFGSPALSQAVLQQAASASGIGTQALRQMLPVMAGMIVAGIVHVMINQPSPAPAAPARREPEPQPSAAFPAISFWNDWVESFASTTNAAAPEPGLRQPAPRPAPVREPIPARDEAPPKPASLPKPDAASDVPLEVFQQMFQTGVQVQEQNAKAMKDIFDSRSRSPEDAPAAGETEAPPPAAGPPETGPTAAKPRKGRSKTGSKAV